MASGAIIRKAEISRQKFGAVLKALTFKSHLKIKRLKQTCHFEQSEKSCFYNMLNTKDVSSLCSSE